VGWKAATTLAKHHRVHVLTSEANRRAIEQVLASSGLANISFTYFGNDGAYCQNRIVARAQSWHRYGAWTKKSLVRAREVLGTAKFDVVHHATFSTCRVACPLWQLGLPTVIGPVGGGESTPWISMGSMSWPQRMYEAGRAAANAMLPFSPSLRQAAKHAGVFLASNQPTREMLLRLGALPENIMTLPVVFFSDEQLRGFAAKRKTEHPRLQLFASGILEGRKGIALVLQAMSMAKRRGLACEMTIPSQGPELGHLRRLAVELGLGQDVHFPDTLSREDYWAKLRDSDVYAMPSLRDNCPATLLEAMLCGCAPIVADCNGPGEVVPGEAGIKIAPASPSEMTQAIAESLLELDANRPKLRDLGTNAALHVRNHFTEKKYLEVIESAYARAIARR